MNHRHQLKINWKNKYQVRKKIINKILNRVRIKLNKIIKTKCKKMVI